MTDRLAAIVACLEQIAEAQRAQRPGYWVSLLWEMDQRTELYRLLCETGAVMENIETWMIQTGVQINEALNAGEQLSAQQIAQIIADNQPGCV